MTLDEIRRKIDAIDLELLWLLEERMSLALRSRKHKTRIEDSHRERAVIERARRLSLNLIEPSFAQGLLESLIGESKRLQAQGRKLVACSGERGSFAEIAARDMLPDGVCIACGEIADVFRELEEGTVDLGVVPAENTPKDPVDRLKITGQTEIPITHCLLAADEADHRHLEVVYARSRILDGCQSYLTRHKLKPRPCHDTAAAVRALLAERPGTAAVIASDLAARMYGLTIIEQNIGDDPQKTTRFLMLSRRSDHVSSHR